MKLLEFNYMKTDANLKENYYQSSNIKTTHQKIAIFKFLKL